MDGARPHDMVQVSAYISIYFRVIFILIASHGLCSELAALEDTENLFCVEFAGFLTLVMACSTGAAVAAAAAGRRAVSRILVHDGMRHARPFMQDMVRFVGEDGYGQSIEQFVQLLTPMSTEVR